MHNTVEAHRKLSEALNKGNSGSPKPLYVVLGNHDEFRINQMSGDKLHGATFVGKDGKTSSKIQANDPNLAAIKEAFKKEVEAAGIPYNEADYFQPDKSTKGELIVVIDPKKKIELKRDLEALNKDGKHNIHVLSPDSQYDGFTRIEQDILDPKTGSKIGKKKIVYISHIPPLTGPNIGRILGENYKTGKTATIPPDADLIIVGDQHTEYDAVVKNFQTDKDVRIVGAGTFSKIRKEGNGSSFILADSEGRPVHVSAENSDVSLRPSGTAPKEQLAYRTPELNALSKALDTPPKETSPTSLKSPNQNSPETNDSSPPESSPSNKRNLASTELSNSHAGPDKAAGRIGCLQTAAESQGILSSGGRLSAANLAALAACGLDEASFRAYAKAGISKVGNFASGASTAIGGGLSLLAYYQGAKGSVEELQKVDFEKFKAAVNGKNPELLKEAFKDVNKLNLASSATTATEGALGFAAAAGTLAGAPTVAAIGTAGALALALPAAVLYSYKRGEDINNQYRNDLSQLDAYEKKYTDNLRNLSLARNSSRIREFRFNKLDQFPDNLCNQNIENVESKKITQEPDGTAGKTCQTRLQTVTNSFADGKFQDAAAKAPISIGFDFCKEGAAALKNGQNNPKALQKAYINFLGCREASRAASQFIQNQIYFMPGKNTKNSFVPRSIAGIVLFTNNEDFNGNNESFVERKQDLKHKGPGFTYLSQDSDSKRNFLEEKNNYNAYLSLNKNEADSLATLMKSKQANSQPKNASYCSQVFSKLEAIDIEVEGLKTACTLAVTEIEARLTAEQKQEVDQLFTKEGIKKEGVGGLYSKATDKTPSSGVPRH
jgi:predicted phosphodiesterase